MKQGQTLVTLAWGIVSQLKPLGSLQWKDVLPPAYYRGGAKHFFDVLEGGATHILSNLEGGGNQKFEYSFGETKMGIGR